MACLRRELKPAEPAGRAVGLTAGRILAPPGRKAGETIEAVVDLQPRKLVLGPDVAVLVFGARRADLELLGLVQAAKGKTGFTRPMEREGAAAVRAEAAFDGIRGAVQGGFPGGPLKCRRKKSDVGSEGRAGLFPAHAAMAMGDPKRFSLDAVAYGPAQTPAGPIHRFTPRFGGVLRWAATHIESAPKLGTR